MKPEHKADLDRMMEDYGIESIDNARYGNGEFNEAAREYWRKLGEAVIEQEEQDNE